MKDVTNHINNVCKVTDDIRLTVQVTLAELDSIFSCANYVLSKNPESSSIAKLCDDVGFIRDMYDGC